MEISGAVSLITSPSCISSVCPGLVLLSTVPLLGLRLSLALRCVSIDGPPSVWTVILFWSFDDMFDFAPCFGTIHLPTTYTTWYGFPATFRIFLTTNVSGIKCKYKILSWDKKLFQFQVFQCEHEHFPWHVRGDFPYIGKISAHFPFSLQDRKWMERHRWHKKKITVVFTLP